MKMLLIAFTLLTSFTSMATDCTIKLNISDDNEDVRILVISELIKKGYQMVYGYSSSPKFLLTDSTHNLDGVIPPGEPLFGCSYTKSAVRYFIENTEIQDAHTDSHGRITYSNMITSQSSEKKVKFPYICAGSGSTVRANSIEKNSLNKIAQAIQELKSCAETNWR